MRTPTRVLFVSTSYPRDAAAWRGIFMTHIGAALARREDMKLAQGAPTHADTDVS